MVTSPAPALVSHGPISTPPAPGTLQPIAQGVYWVRQPLPFALDHINLWLIEAPSGWTLVDTGLSSETTRAWWRCWLAGGTGGRPLERVIATHFHPDHLGLAGWLPEAAGRPDGVPLWMTRSEWLTGLMLTRAPSAAEDQARFFQIHGLPADRAERIRRGGNRYRSLIEPPPDLYHRVQDGDLLNLGGHDWRALVVGGHSPEQLCLHCPALGLLISGDHILPQISPNISVSWFEPDANPLQEYLASFDRFSTLPDDTLVAPSHGRPFRGLHARLAELRHHHRERLRDALAACLTPQTAHDLLPVLFRRDLDDHQLSFAMGEAVAHLHLLADHGLVRAAPTEKRVTGFQATDDALARFAGQDVLHRLIKPPSHV